jgi:hypothetical protein
MAPARRDNSELSRNYPELSQNYPELSRNYPGIIPNYPGGQVPSTTARDLPSTRAGGQDDVSSKQTPSNESAFKVLQSLLNVAAIRVRDININYPHPPKSIFKSLIPH